MAFKPSQKEQGGRFRKFWKSFSVDFLYVASFRLVLLDWAVTVVETLHVMFFLCCFGSFLTIELIEDDTYFIFKVDELLITIMELESK